ncbi:hypothetical protein HOLleu_13948 [Holothuria leucospilota]|uniref:Uncharacterized protein n=1 Tax=Holothuria leucospilota TaxID=206669 RepID=A0A9Q1HBE6_HOLLE|nr:hypothetical protein HOLleu_13948 [Holothuria leucospilota]
MATLQGIEKKCTRMSTPIPGAVHLVMTLHFLATVFRQSWTKLLGQVQTCHIFSACLPLHPLFNVEETKGMLFPSAQTFNHLENQH